VPEPSTETRQTYDTIAVEYARRTSTVFQGVRDDVTALRGHLPCGSLVADIGCGPGRDTDLLRAQDFRVVALDLSMGQLRAGGLRDAVQADMCHLPLRTGLFDAVWCQAALLHVPRTVAPVAVAEFARVLRPGGRLNLVVAEGDGEGWELASTYGVQLRRWFTYHRQDGLSAVLGGVGFRIDFVRRSQFGRDWLTVHAERLPG
jgi:SAM-dependent methyltransferase